MVSAHIIASHSVGSGKHCRLPVSPPFELIVRRRIILHGKTASPILGLPAVGPSSGLSSVRLDSSRNLSIKLSWQQRCMAVCESVLKSIFLSFRTDANFITHSKSASDELTMSLDSAAALVSMHAIDATMRKRRTQTNMPAE